MPDKIEIHEYERASDYSVFCGVCGQLPNHQRHLNLWRYMGGIGKPEVLASVGGVYKFKRIQWNGSALYVNNSGEREERYYLDADKFKRMGQPSHIKLLVRSCHPNGLPVFDA